MKFTKDGTCWLEGSFIFSFYAPLYFYTVFAIGVIVYAAVKLDVNGQARHGTGVKSRKRAIRMVSQMIVFSMGFLAVWFWGIVFRLLEYTNSGNASYVPDIHVNYASTFFLGFGGFVNAMIWSGRVITKDSCVYRMKNCSCCSVDASVRDRSSSTASNVSNVEMQDNPGFSTEKNVA